MIRPPNRLRAAMAASGGFSVREAVRRSEAAVDTLRDPCLESIDATLAEIELRFGPKAAGRDAEDYDTLYGLATRIIDVSLVVRHSGLDDASRALCELADLSSEIGRWDWPSVEVHIEALKMLRAAGEAMTKDQRNAVIQGLVKVTRKRVGDPKAIAAAAAGEA
jgi:hypothetical protein